MADRPDWQRAACKDHDPELWFPASESLDTTAEPRAICWACPIQPECADWALATRQPSGVWGALTTDQRRSLLRTRRASLARVAVEA
jgi:WhiB family transcriptional regulator, redox-sensing transcriptional regulator